MIIKINLMQNKMKTFIYVLFLFFINVQLFASDIAVLTMAVGEKYKDAVLLGLKNKEHYCKKHGYDFYFSEEHLDPTRPIAWSKIVFVQKIMEEHSYKWIFWTDADSLIMNTNIPLENFIDNDFNFVISRAHTWVNSGEFFIKNCDWSKNYLKTVYAHEEYINDGAWEQTAIVHELNNPEFKPYIKIIPQRAINSRLPFDWTGVSYLPGDFIIHFAGTRDLKTLKALTERYAKAVID